MNTLGKGLFAIGFGLRLAAVPCSAAQTPLQLVTAARDRVYAHVDALKAREGSDLTVDLATRLNADIEELSDPSQRPPQYSVSDWNERLASVAALDVSFADQALAGKSEPLAGARGLVERLSRSRADGTLQPYALYVPAAIGPHPPVVVLLHGRPQTESELLGPPYFRALADRTGTIVIAPWGRGYYDFAAPADQDVYAALDDVEAAFPIDAHRVYLAGYSMGGFSVFRVGPLQAQRWRAVMCISGAILNSETETIRFRFRDTPFYVVTGSRDVNIPTVYAELTASYLMNAGIPVSFYEQDGGTHYLPTLMPSLSKAWDDMLANVVRAPQNLRVAGKLPGAVPAAPAAGFKP
ncbi:MAG: alpha/beta fold hydrolase [Vulcanimicrobiaceae bacterium]